MTSIIPLSFVWNRLFDDAGNYIGSLTRRRFLSAVFFASFAFFAVKSFLTAKDAEKFLHHRDKPVPTMVPRVFHRLHGVTCGLQSNHMQDHTETLSVGARAPEFLLSAANREGILSLSGFLNRGTLILEFLRGTW
jgi:hypothetical protein